MPELVPPMLAAAGPLPDGGDWVVEFAWEGLRCLAHVRPDRARLRTVNGRDVTSSFPELVEPLTRRAPRGGMVLDGTVVAVGEGGLPRRRLLQRRTATARPSAAVLRRTPVALIVGDLLWLAGHDLATLPYHRRRELLEELGLVRTAGRGLPDVPGRGGRGRHAHRRGVRRGGAARPPPRRPVQGRAAAAVLGAGPAAPVGAGGRRGLDAGGPAPAGSGRRAAARRAATSSRTAGLRYVGRAGIGAGEEQREVAAQLAPPAPRRLAVRRAAARRGRPRRAVGRAPPGRAGRVHRLDGRRAAAPPRVARAPHRATGTPGGRCSARRGHRLRRRMPRSPVPRSSPARRAATAPPEPAPDIGAAAVQATEARRLEQHFVYNALNTIAALMRTDPARARELLLGFADLNRAADRPDGHTRHARRRARRRAGLPAAGAGPVRAAAAGRDRRRRGAARAADGAPQVLDAVRAMVQQRIEPRPGGGTLTVTAERAGAGCLVRVGERDGDGRDSGTTVVPTG